MTDFVHLHVHSEYSLLDGACVIRRSCEAAAKMGQKALAITDHGVMYGVVDFYREAKKHGIKPIIGCEVYTAPRSRFDKQHGIDNDLGHLVLLAKNNVGYHNIMKLVSLGFVDGFYGKPRIDLESLAEYSEGVIALSACIAGFVPKAILRGDYEGAKEIARKHQEIFKDGYYIEIQDHGIEEQKRALPQLVRLARELSLPLVATNDAHYIAKDNAYAQEVLMCIQTGKTMDDENRMHFDQDKFYLKSGDEMEQLFGQYPNAIENTLKIAEQCNVEIEFGKIHLPKFPIPDQSDPEAYLDRLCQEGFVARYGENPRKELVDRLEYEMSVIKKMGYVDYFLIVQDFINYAKENDIPVGPGRGSAAGSIVAYSLRITDIDPIQHQLLFERFLNPERVTMPDIDIDFCYERRQEVIDYVVEKYGREHVAQIITFGTMAARMAIRDVGRVLNIPYAQVDQAAKLVPTELHMSIKKALKASAQLRELYENDPSVHTLIDTASQLEGMPRHASTHAAGVVITSSPVSDYVPLQKTDQLYVTQFPMTTLEELGLLKMDFLGLRNLTVIRDAEKMIQKYDPAFQIALQDLEDPAVYKLLSAGNTLGVFQLESNGIRQVLTGLRPQNFEDIIAVISLYRPGPMDSIPKYIENKHHPERVTYKHPLLKDILDVTYGCIVYQEQVMQIVQKLGGYSYGRADLVRRAMSKKKADVMEQERHNFLYGKKNDDGTVECCGAIANGVDEKTANDIFEEMTAFASYAFNKSHAAAYAVIAYQTAYLKAHYAKEYFAALLTSILGSADKVSEYIGECNRLCIPVLPPHINKSEMGFSVEGEEIRFGLLAVKNVGKGVIQNLLDERNEQGAFLSFDDFISRMYQKDLNKKAVECFIKCGAMDGLGLRRSQMLRIYESAIDSHQAEGKRNLEGQESLFGMMDIPQVTTAPDIPELSRKELLAFEKETAGLYLSGHPMLDHQEKLTQLKLPTIRDVVTSIKEGEGQFHDGDTASIGCMITASKIKITKTNQSMAFVTVEDITGMMETVVFPRDLQRFASLLEVDNVIVLTGRLSEREDEVSIVLQKAERLEDYFSAAQERLKKVKKLYLRVPSQDSAETEELLAMLSDFPGDTPVGFYYEDQKKYDYDLSAPIFESEGLIKALREEVGSRNVVLK